MSLNNDIDEAQAIIEGRCIKCGKLPHEIKAKAFYPPFWKDNKVCTICDPDTVPVKERWEVKTRRLSERWTLEASQDAEAFHGVDVEAEIMQALAQKIVVEIDQEVLRELKAMAKKK